MSSESTKTGVLLINVGTPDSPAPGDVRRYLRQFLSDPQVIDIHPLGRWLLLNLFILPFRPRRSGAAYEKVWMEEGSPLLVHSVRFKDGLQAELGENFHVVLGMRYGNPSLSSAVNELIEERVDRIVVFPLYPQYAASSTGTSLEEIHRLLANLPSAPELKTVAPFYDDPGFVEAVRELGAPLLRDANPDHVLFSFHGLPERHMHKIDSTGRHCLKTPNCCDKIVEANRHCYKAQCYSTARATAASLGLEDGTWSVSFQSRLGRTPWIQPYTDLVIPQLAADGCRRLVVFCSAFVADCLETLEEIGIRAKDDFLAVGGESLVLVPAVNAHPSWLRAAAQLILRESDSPS